MDVKSKYVTRYTWTGKKEETKTKKRKVVVGTETVEKSGLLGKKKSVEKQITETETYEAPTGKFLRGFPDVEDLGDRVQKICNELDASGYDVISIMPIQIGEWDFEYKTRTIGHDGGAGYGYGYGMGITRGAIITGKLKD